jgi:hypothetical protein
MEDGDALGLRIPKEPQQQVLCTDVGMVQRPRLLLGLDNQASGKSSNMAPLKRRLVYNVSIARAITGRSTTIVVEARVDRSGTRAPVDPKRPTVSISGALPGRNAGSGTASMEPAVRFPGRHGAGNYSVC